MRPLPRLIAVADDNTCQAADFPIWAAAVLSLGPSAGVLLKTVAASDVARKQLTRIRSLARPAEAPTFAYGDPDLARATGVQGLVLPADGSGVAKARSVFGGPIGVIVSSSGAAADAIRQRCDFLLADRTPPDQATTMVRSGCEAAAAEWGGLVYVDGDCPLAQLLRARASGAYGVVASRSIWDARDPAEAVIALLAAWEQS